VVLREPKGLDDQGFNDIKLKVVADFIELAYYLPVGRTGREERCQKKGSKMH
jgi:hypothetical protein